MQIANTFLIQFTLLFSGQPKVRLSARNRIDPSEAEEVSDEVVLTWAPCAKHDKSYEVEMWDLGEERKEKKDI